MSANFVNPEGWDLYEAVYPSGFTPPRIAPVVLNYQSIDGDFNDGEDQLLGQKTTRVSYKKVYAKLDVRASNRGSLDSARREALRSVEQFELDKERKKVDRANRKRPRGRKRVQIGNAKGDV